MGEKYLIFDIGMHEGQDTAYYLQQGAKVVAVEADSSLCAAAAIKFHDAINRGDLTILNIAISDSNSEIVFHRSEHSEWSSIHRANSSRNEQVVETVVIRATRLLDVIEEYGMPYYCKIDIEGADLAALKSLENNTTPLFISAESESFPDRNDISDQQALEILYELNTLGYRQYKLVDQYSLQVLNFTDRPFKYQKPNNSFPLKVLNRLKSFLPAKEKSASIFTAGSSGAFAHQLAGEWISFEEAKELLILHRNDLYENPFFRNLQFWADWHATV